MTVTTAIEDLIRWTYKAGLEDLEKRLPDGYEFTGEFRNAEFREPHLPVSNAVGLGPYELTCPRLILRKK